MEARSLAILWPLLLSPLAGILLVKFSGSGFDGTVNQKAILVLGLGFVAWWVVLLVGFALTLSLLKNKTKVEVFVLFCATLAGGVVQFWTALWMN
jgi:hypothetical protein